VIALTDSSGALVAGYAYTPYGALSSRTGTVNTELQYTGQYTDAESGLLYLRARYYDPATAQFLTVDPAVRTTLSPYGYVGGDPLNNGDPSGLCGWCKVVTGGVAGTVWATSSGGDSSGGSGASGGGSSGGGARSATECEKDAIDYALKPDQVEHVFGKAIHNLQGLVNDMGGRENAMHALIKSVGKVPDGIYGTSNPLIREVGNYTITIRGRMMDGVFKISTAFIP
jgi:RHS repeat-associated protein